MARKTATEYIDELIEQGFSTPDSICKEAEKRLDEIEKKIEEKSVLIDLLKIHNYNSKYTTRKKTFTEQVTTYSTNKDISNSIIILVEKMNKENISKKEILIEVGYDNQDPTPVYIVLKDLLEKGILKQNDVDRSVSKGHNWDSGKELC